MSLITQYAALSAMLVEMERDLGFAEMTKAEKAILAAITTLQERTESIDFISSADIQKHELCKPLAAPTFFRALASLLENKFIILPDGRAKGLYRLHPRLR
jgi:hypothetical protein